MATWVKDWNEAKKLYEQTTGKKKPSEKVLGFFRKSSGIENALAAAQKAEADASKATNAKTTITALEGAVQKAHTAIDAYLKQLATAVAGDKEADPAYEKGLKVLKTQLKAISTNMDVSTTRLKDQANGVDALASIVGNMHNIIDGGVKKARAVIAKVRANPTPEEYNKHFPKAARDITQNLGNLAKFRTKYPDLTLPDVAPDLMKLLVKFADKPYHNVPADLESAKVEKVIGLFDDGVKGVSAWLKRKEFAEINL